MWIKGANYFCEVRQFNRLVGAGAWIECDQHGQTTHALVIPDKRSANPEPMPWTDTTSKPAQNYKKTWQDKKGYYRKQYRSSSLDCKNCPLRKNCIGKTADYKKIEHTIHKPLYEQMHERLRYPYAKAMKKRRQATVEPVLGTLINFMGVRRIW